MPEQTPVDRESPLWNAWVAYQQTEDYLNTLNWYGKPSQAPESTLWAAFAAGFRFGLDDRRQEP
ncbi:MAG: hypothetical protein IT434_09570 [Phycisphaerales bacterium]|nr:hypothetical protein [Phycisphaerales bacterium]